MLHATATSAGARYSRGVRRVAAMPLASRRLGLAGVADRRRVPSLGRRRDALSRRIQARQAQGASRRRGAALRPGAVSRGNDRPRRSPRARCSTARRAGASRSASTTSCGALTERRGRGALRSCSPPAAPRPPYTSGASAAPARSSSSAVRRPCGPLGEGVARAGRSRAALDNPAAAEAS